MSTFYSSTQKLQGKTYTELKAIIYRAFLDDNILRRAQTLAKEAGGNGIIDVRVQPIEGIVLECIVTCTAVYIGEYTEQL